MKHLRATDTVGWILRLTVLLQSIGALKDAYANGTPIGTTLFVTFRWPESQMLLVDHGLAWLLFGAALTCVVRPTKIGAGFVSAWFLTVAVLGHVQGGHFAHYLMVPAHAARWLTPLALLAWSEGDDARSVAEWLARTGISATFIAHGIEALIFHPNFVDYIIAAGERIVALEISQAHAEVILLVIGVIDLALAAAVMAGRNWRVVFLYMAAWGLITACARVVHFGPEKWPAVAVRAPHYALPIVLMIVASRRRPGDGEEE